MSSRGKGMVSGRRGLLAGAAALVAGGLAKLAGPGRVEAGHTGLANPEPLHIGVINDGTGVTNVETQTSITATTSLVTNNGSAAFRGRQLGATSTSFGLDGISGFTGVQGQSVANTNGTSGMFGQSNVIGVRGFSISTFAQSVGVLGFLTNAGNPFPSYNTQAGVLGITLNGVGGAGVAGVATTNGTGTTVSNTGVHGQSTTGTGVRGDSSSGVGVEGQSAGSVGVLGVSQNFYGVFARSTNSVALAATSPSFAGIFTGDVFITGTLTVASGAKSASVKKRNGEHARVYCQESPEPWFEDFGTGELRNGQASVPLDPEFDEVVDGTAYRVFLTEIGDCGGLYVSRKGPHRFEVRSRGGNAAGGTFDYRVVARRKDPVGGRLEKVNVPTLPKVADLPKTPTVRTAPTAPPAPDHPDRPER